MEIAGLRQIIAEPIFFESAVGQLWVYWMVWGFVSPKKVFLFDCCIINADSPSLEHSFLESIFTGRKNVQNGHFSEAAKKGAHLSDPFLSLMMHILIWRSNILSKEWQFNSPRNENVATPKPLAIYKRLCIFEFTLRKSLLGRVTH